MRFEENNLKISRRTLSKSAVASLVALNMSRSIRAQDATPEEAAATDTGVTTEVLLTGLADPRFVRVIDGEVYFTEAGTGGDEAIYTIPGEGTPEPTDPISHSGLTGKLSRLEADGSVTVLSDKLRSYTFGAVEIVGASGFAFDGEGSAYVAVGSLGPNVSTTPRFGDEGGVVKVDLATGDARLVGDILANELANNPDPATIDSNVFGLALVDGIAYVADSGGNAILAVDVASGDVSTFAVTGGLQADFLPETGNPARGGAREIDSVPSGVSAGPDGRIYVAYTTGGPFPAGIAPIDAFSPDGTKETVVTGLTMSSDIAWSSDGTMYVSIMSTDMINGGPGQVVRIEEDGTYTVVVDGLSFAGGIAFDADDTLYVINKASIVPGGGELLRVTGVTEVPAGTGSATTDATAVAEETEEAAAGDAANTFKINFIDTAFEPNELTIPANTDVTLQFENTGFLAHDFALTNPEVVSDVLGNGGTTSLVLNLEPGTYEFHCTQVGHRELGMVGTLTVE